MRQLSVSLYDSPCSQNSIGGLSAYSSRPRCGNNQSPDSNICFAARAKRGSSDGHGSRNPIPAASTMNAITMNRMKSPRRESDAELSAVSVIGVWICILLAERRQFAIQNRRIAEIQFDESFEFREAVQVDLLPLETDAMRHDVRGVDAHADDHAGVDAQIHAIARSDLAV